MLSLDLPTEPYWIELARGVHVRVRPVTTALMAAAQAGAARQLEAVRAAEPDMEADLARGTAFAACVKALARHVVVDWKGVGNAAGEPIPCAPDDVERLMEFDFIATAFWDAVTRPAAAVSAEGNG
jgi:hypothetical protein